MESNSAADADIEALEGLVSKSRAKLETRLYRFAAEANPDNPGALDIELPLRNMPPELTGVRHKHFGRHRIYYTGHHKACSYRLIHVKPFKKDDVDAEHDGRFQSKLAKARKADGVRLLAAPSPEGSAK